MGDEDVLVLYEDSDENHELSSAFESSPCGPEPNAFLIPSHKRSSPVRLHHVAKHFPLSHLDPGGRFVYRVQHGDGKFYDVTNPGSAVPRVGPGGAVILRVSRSPVPLPRPLPEDVERELSAPVPHDYFQYRKFGKDNGLRLPGGGPASPHAASFIKQERIDDTIETVKQSAKKIQDLGRKVSHSISTIDEEKIKKGMKKIGSGMKGLWKNLKESTETFISEVQQQTVTGQTLSVGTYDIRVQTLLAEGGFSMVFLAKDETAGSPTAGQSLALKKMVCQTKEARKDALMEIKLLKACNHKNIIKLLSSSSEASEGSQQRGAKDFYLLFPFIEESAYNVIEKNVQKGRNYDYSNVNSYQSPYSEPDALEVLHGLLSALHYLHSNLMVVHRDVKPHNILLRFDSCGYLGGPTPLVMDVGSAAPSSVAVKDRTAALNAEEECSQKCSAPYRAPELWEVQAGNVLTAAADIWSVGCTAFAFAFGYSPFETPKEGVMKLAILNGTFRYPNSQSVTQFSEGYRGLIESMLSRDPNARPDAAAALRVVEQLAVVYRD